MNEQTCLLKAGEPRTQNPQLLRKMRRYCWLFALLLLGCIASNVKAQFLYVTNNGAITITDYNGPDGAVNIPDTINGLPVKSIAMNAFNGIAGITSVAIPASVTNIGLYALSYCPDLTNIGVNVANPAYSSAEGVLLNKSQTLLIQFPAGKSGSYTVPDSVTSIDDYAFDSSANLSKITIPDTVTKLGDSVFQYCSSLVNVSIGNGVPRIGWDSFYACTALSVVTLGNSITNIDDNAFNGCISLVHLTVPSSVVRIGNRAFSDCEWLMGISFGDKISSIGQFSFAGCKLLSTIALPDSIVSIGSYAFVGCSNLESVAFQGGAPIPGGGIFDGNDKLTSYYFSGATNWSSTFAGRPTAINTFFSYTTNGATLSIKKYSNLPHLAAAIPRSVGGRIVTTVGSNAFSGTLKGIVIPNSITTIESHAFDMCDLWSGIVIPNSVTNIGSCVFFEGNIDTILVDAHNSSYSDKGGVLFNKQLTILVVHPNEHALFENAYIIPASVTNIADGAFNSNYRLYSITIPENVISIGDSAFAECGQLASIIIPNSVITIGNGAFLDCHGITNVNLGDHVAIIGGWAFGSCYNLLNIAVGNSVSTIGSGAFRYCSALTNVWLGNFVTDIGSFAFMGDSSLTQITIDPNNPKYCSAGGVLFNKDKSTLIAFPNGISGCYIIPVSVTNVGEFAFAECGLTNIIIPNNVTTISANSFSQCYNITTIIIPNSVSFIGNGAFFINQLTSVFFMGNAPASDCSTNIFAGAYETLIVYYLSGTTGWGGTFGGQPTAVWYLPVPFTFFTNQNKITITGYTGSDSSVVIPNSIKGFPVNWIGTEAFRGNTNITSVAFPSSVSDIGGLSFEECSSLTNITFANGLINIWYGAFVGCTSLNSIILPNGLKRIDFQAFDYCTGLTNVVIPNSVTNINSFAFADCARLTSVSIPAGVLQFGDAPFGGCDSLLSINVDVMNPAYSSVAGILYNQLQTILVECPGGKFGPVTIPNTVTNVADQAFSGCAQLTGVTFGVGVKSIGVAAFSGCSLLSSINLKNSIEFVGTRAFAYCESLASVLLGGNVRDVGENAFANCGKLVNVGMTNGLLNIGTSAFSGCTNLPVINIPNTVTNISSYAFAGDFSLGTVNLGTNVISIGNGSFFDCGVTTVAIPNSTRVVQQFAFYGCPHLATVNIGAGSTSIGWEAFSQCPNLLAISVDAANSYYSSVSGILFDETQTELIKCPEGKPGRFTIPNSVINIYYGAFMKCVNLTGVTFGTGVQTIGGSAFYGCTSLTAVGLTNNIKTLGSEAFARCTSLSSVTLGTNVTSIGYSAFAGTLVVSLSIPSGVTNIAPQVFVGNRNFLTWNVDNANSFYTAQNGVLFNKALTTLISYPSALSGAYNIPVNVNNIADYAFIDCTGLTSIAFPAGMTNIGYYAFEGCAGLTAMNITPNVTRIGDGAFGNCSSMMFYSVDSANSSYSSSNGVLLSKNQGTLIQYPVAKLGDYLFPDSVTNIAWDAFSGCTGLRHIKLGRGLQTIPDAAFRFCGSLSSITIPNTVTNIGWYAFMTCSNLSTMWFEGLPPTLSDGRFDSEVSAIVYYVPTIDLWGATFGGLATAPWLPAITNRSNRYNISNEPFLLDVKWASGQDVILEATAYLAIPTWKPLATNSVVNGSATFADASWTNSPTRYYRVRSL